ncbi:MAG: DNA translocase FtsK 4TM domain-containing protein [Alistipes sp.]|nr:DNA translocase FtsK 4TM domain-containing protein [Alistipes sp.]
MAQRVTKNTKAKGKAAAAAATPAPGDNMSWMAGFVLLIVGLFSVVSVLSHFLHWSSDLSALRNDPALSGEEIPFENICSSLGANVAYLMVDASFGIFGIVIPIVLTVLGWRIFRKKSLHLNHFGLSAALVLIMGSLTLGLVAMKFSIPYDVGGELGQACAADLTSLIGVFGTVLVLLTGWILTGVFINRNFRRIVDGIGDGVEKQGDRMKRVVEDAIAARNRMAEQEPESEEEPTVEPQPAVEPVSQPVVAEPAPAPVLSRPVEESKPAERPLTMNEYLAAKREEQIGHPDYGRTMPEPDFYIEGEQQQNIALEPEQEVSQKELSQYEDDGFEIIPTEDIKPAPIDVEALLAAREQERIERSLDELGFAVVQRDAPTSTAVETLPAEAQVAERDEDGFFVEPSVEPVEQPVQKLSSAQPKNSSSDDIVVTVRENAVRRVAEEDIDMNLYDPLRDLETYKKPYVSLLEDYKSPHKVSDAEIYDNKCRIEETLKYFGIPINDIQATVGPTVTLYEIVQAQGVKISKVQGLEKDIAQSLRAQGIRIIAPIPGRGTIGIEVPNRDKQIVSMYSAICSEEFQHANMELPVVIGRTIQNTNFTFDLAKMPHLLVAGATGQVKSVGLNAIITSLLYSKHPAQLKFVMIDPKMVEFSVYNKLERHFLAKMESEDEAIVTDPKKAVYVLNSLVEEMGRRLELCKMATARNIVEYNEKFTARRLNPNKGHRFLPYIVVIVDEFADLIMTAKEVEVPVMRLAQKARAVGIHLIIATQRPDVRVITGGIKANFPSRIAFRVIQMIDSRTIIDQPGANQLIGRGDMLFSKDGELTRVQCALVETKEVERLVDYIAKQQGYTEAYPLPDYTPEAGGDGAGMASDGESGAPMKYDSLFGEVARAAVTNGIISTSSIQRNYEVGFNRAGRIMLQLERAGIVGPQMGAKPREIKFYDLPSLEAKLQELGVF